jgi:hypothetical protein
MMNLMGKQLTRRGFALLTALLVTGCTSAAGPSQAEREARAAEANALAAQLAANPLMPPTPGEIRVRLAFGERADLDLYVTDPRQETVYFANSPSRAGGRLDRDARCDEPLPRVETVAFDAAPPGRYRVGVDFPPLTCDGATGPVAFIVVFESYGQRHEKRLSIRPGEFIPIVLEADVH